MHLPKVLRYPNFKKLYFAGLTSEMGSFITETALMLTVFELSSQNKAFLGFARAVFLFCLTIGNLLGGSLGEKFNRRDLLIFTNYARIPLVLSLMFFTNIYLVIVVDGLIALFTGIYNPTRQALINDIVPQKDISKANALSGSTFAIIHMLCPFLGAVLYSHFKGITEVLSFDLLTYFLGIYLLSTVLYKIPKADQHKSKQSILNDTIEGFKYAYERKDISTILTNSILGGICIGFLIPLLLPYFIEVLKMDETAYGIAFSFFGLGGAIGGWLSQKLSKNISNGKLIMYGICTEPVLMFIWLLFPGFYNTLFIFLIWGMAVFVRTTCQFNYISEKVETKYLTRVFSLLDLSFVFPNIISGIIVSIIGESATTYEILYFVSILFILLVFPRLPLKSTKALFYANSDKVSRDTSAQDTLG